MTQERMNPIEQRPLISVIVPVYKVEKYIHRCVDSILQQTYTNLEIILVDDGSPDQCGVICDYYATKDSRIRVIHQDNRGISEARNAGCGICSGEYLAFVDSDDCIKLDYFEVLLNAVEDADYVSCGFSRINEVDEDQYLCMPDREWVMSGEEVLRKHYSGENGSNKISCVYVWGKLYKKVLWDGLLFPKEWIFEDISVMPYLLLRCKKLKFIPYAGYCYREVPTSITNDTSEGHTRKGLIDSIAIWEEHCRLYREIGMQNLVVAVECLKVEKIMSQMLAGIIPIDLVAWSKKTMKKSIRFLCGQPIDVSKKVRYILFALFGANTYRKIRDLFK